MARLRIRHPGDPLHEKTQPPATPNMDRTSPCSAASKIETSVSTTTRRSSLSATYAAEIRTCSGEAPSLDRIWDETRLGCCVCKADVGPAFGRRSKVV